MIIPPGLDTYAVRAERGLSKQAMPKRWMADALRLRDHAPALSKHRATGRRSSADQASLLMARFCQLVEMPNAEWTSFTSTVDGSRPCIHPGWSMRMDGQSWFGYAVGRSVQLSGTPGRQRSRKGHPRPGADGGGELNSRAATTAALPPRVQAALRGAHVFTPSFRT